MVHAIAAGALPGAACHHSCSCEIVCGDPRHSCFERRGSSHCDHDGATLNMTGGAALTADRRHPRRRRVVLLQHGSHGWATDFQYLASLLRRLDPDALILQPRVNEAWLTDSGIVACGARLADYCVEALHAAFPKEGGGGPVVVDFSVVGHSMGGLVVREALPRIAADLFPPEDGASPSAATVEWNVFCTVGAPHTGVAQMPSLLRRVMGRYLMSPFSVAYRELFGLSDVLQQRLLQDEHLQCLRKFQRRVLIGGAHDMLVPTTSSILQCQSGSAGLRSDGVFPPPLGSLEEMETSKGIISAPLSEANWPAARSTVERDMAQRLLHGAGLVETFLVDFSRPAMADGWRSAYAAWQLTHTALICKSRLSPTTVFGFPSEFIAKAIVAS